ncbi:MarR family winged helix-turn-helix transcriptional regulator [Cryobacterium sp. TMT4-31]|uniref:MarR family winged helix-turn-helix transcriptional regulator n=1 Tax=Cryobacterium sp. TMT4-31 TaxID=1259259 RepID=UPI00106AB442|nr:MarR family transcriptional regulator [Cryobacterium sp. TMT4-31]TFC89476.1 MarR family transcriptional regulator [Cryobacterium sp. TMT4-31]
MSESPIAPSPPAPAPAPAPAAAHTKRRSVAELSHDFRLANGRLARRVRQEQADNELTSGQFSALGAVFRLGPMTLSALSEEERVTPPSMNRTVNALVEAGLVNRAGSAEDGRKVVLTVTDTGMTLVRETRRRRDDWIATRILRLTPEQRQILASATEIMKELANS